MPDGLYDSDILTWSERQAGLLRRLAAGERVNDAVDWDNLIEEVESVGRAELNSCRGLLRQALRHLLKLHAWPGSSSAQYWRAEASVVLTDARHSFSPSMRRRLDLAAIYDDALRLVRADIGAEPPQRPWPPTLPVTLDALLAPDAAPATTDVISLLLADIASAPR